MSAAHGLTVFGDSAGARSAPSAVPDSFPVQPIRAEAVSAVIPCSCPYTALTPAERICRFCKSSVSPTVKLCFPRRGSARRCLRHQRHRNAERQGPKSRGDWNVTTIQSEEDQMNDSETRIEIARSRPEARAVSAAASLARAGSTPRPRRMRQGGQVRLYIGDVRDDTRGTSFDGTVPTRLLGEFVTTRTAIRMALSCTRASSPRSTGPTLTRSQPRQWDKRRKCVLAANAR